MGVSGDMFLASLIDLGVPLRAVMAGIRRLPVARVGIRLTRETRHSVTASCFRVPRMEERHHRTFKDIKALINKSSLEKGVKDLSVAIFRRVAEAEALIHGTTVDKVHFHEVGAMDSIIDIVGAAIAIDCLKPDKIISSPIALGSGWTKTMHGTLPVPAPATLEILRGAPVFAGDAPFELTTPTGAAIVMTLAEGYGAMPAMTIEKIGYGAGKKDFKEKANVLRAVLGSMQRDTRRGAHDTEDLIVIETNIDDMNPQIAGYLMERLLKAGALDAFITPVYMKKSRPGVLLTALSKDVDKERLLGIIFSESTSLGIRTCPVQRHCLERRSVQVETVMGRVRVKTALKGKTVMNAQPEYEDCRKIAEEKGVPLKDVMDMARAALKRKVR